MHTTINTFYAFADAFNEANRGEQFSTQALRVLFDYLEQLEEDLGESIELDVVALCCDYSEMNWREVVEHYNVPRSGDESPDELAQCVREYLEENTQVCGEFTDDNGDVVFVFQQF